ncbi:MAG: hypothetical protein A3I01_09585 [Betaproteobacteria bacterium RIFCSPLOWO2_02_FULL_65_24]|nr:MAG: hypothetical protein A3I01_09585 [Betaproteobacteria bacterium RIFCSPLOWO2_02_FULL_65_24]
MKPVTLIGSLVVALGLALAPCIATAQQAAWPSKPIRFVVPYPPGSSGDLIARKLAPYLSKALGGQIVVDNRSGANGSIGMENVAHSAPDGHSFVFGTDIQFAIAPILYKLPYDTEKDFEPVALVTVIEIVLLAHPSVAANNLQELVKLAKAQPGKINYASTGIGSTHQLAVELLKQRGGFDLTHVPYKGTGQALPDLVAGQVQVMFAGITQSMQYLNSGRLKALAVASQKRQAVLPDVPTVAESGFPGYEANAYWAIWAPAGTPAAITQKLYAELRKQLDLPEVRDWFEKSGLAASAAGAEELAARIRADRARWTQVVSEAKIKVDQ